MLNSVKSSTSTPWWINSLPISRPSAPSSSAASQATCSSSPSLSWAGLLCKFLKGSLKWMNQASHFLIPSDFSDIFSYLVNKPKDQRSLTKELIAALLASIFAGFGAIFLIMWTGIFLWAHSDKRAANTYRRIILMLSHLIHKNAFTNFTNARTHTVIWIIISFIVYD